RGIMRSGGRRGGSAVSGSTRDRELMTDDEDEPHFDEPTGPPRVFDSHPRPPRQPASVLPALKPIIFAPHDSVTDAVRSMQAEHRGCVLVTRDGTPAGQLAGIFTER